MERTNGIKLFQVLEAQQLKQKILALMNPKNSQLHKVLKIYIFRSKVKCCN